MLYIDLNMVRAGVTGHPSEWPFCGYNEIQNPPGRYSQIDRRQLMRLLGIDDSDKLRKAYNSWLAAALRKGGHARDTKWTQSIAVGSKVFIENVKDQLGYKAIGSKMSPLRVKNSFKWNVWPINSV